MHKNLTTSQRDFCTCYHFTALWRAWVTLTALLLTSSLLYSQGNAGRILGTVTDNSGAFIAGATVGITDVQRGITRTLTADDAGEYAAPNLLPGEYTVTASMKGFKSLEHSKLLLEVGQDLRVDLVLQAGDQLEKVVVYEEIPVVDTTTTTLGGTIGNEMINELPINGRDYQKLLALRPGVMIYPGGGAWSQSANGVRPESNAYVLDGLDNTDPFSALSVINAPGLVGDAVTVIPIDAIQEFNSQINPKAEFGWKPGFIANVGLKSGTNELHGTAYAFGRSDALDARNYFNPPPNPTVPLDFKQFGATAGGRIRRDKLFYFLGYEAQRYTVGNSYVTSIPTTASGVGSDVSIPDAEANLAAHGIPLSQLSVNLLSLYPSNSAPTSSFTLGFPNANSSDSGLAKIDYHINEHHAVNGMFFYGRDDETAQDQPYLRQEWLSINTQRPITGAVSWVYAANSRIVNEARFGYLHQNRINFSADGSLSAAAYGIPTGVTDPHRFGLPQISIAGLNSLGGQANFPKFQGPDGLWQARDTLSYLHGTHTFKFGPEYRYATVTEGSFRGAKGQFQFSGGGAFCPAPTDCSTGLEDFLAGVPTFGKISYGDPLRHLTQNMFAIFAQDDWRITRRLTLNLGVRYEYAAPMKEQHNLLGNFDPNAGLVQVGKQISSPYNPDHTNLAPRIGAAWDIHGNGRTVLRAGGGISYDTLSMETYLVQENTQNATALGIGTIPTGANIVLNNIVTPGTGNIAVSSNRITCNGGPNCLNWNLTGPVFPVAPPTCGDGINGDPAPCDVLGVDRHLKTPYVATWTVGLQHAFTNDLSVDVAYVGNRGVRLVGIRDTNQVDLATGVTPFGAQFPYLGFINILSNQYSSNYNGLQVTVTQRSYHGLAFLLGYTYSHAFDYSSTNQNQFLPQDSTRPGLEYASSDYDIRHRFTLSMTYDIPGREAPGQLLKGWQLNSIISVQSPQPWTVNDTVNNISGSNEATDRWDFFGNPKNFQSSNHSIPYCTGPGAGGCSETVASGQVVQFSDAQSTALFGACLAAAQNVDGGAVGGPTSTSLAQFGCYAQGSSVMIPPAAGTFGTMGRNLFRDSGFRSWDLSVVKTWKFREHLRAQLRGEFFNVLNHPSFANPYGGTSGYGPGAFNDPSSLGAFGCGCATPDQAGGNPVVGSGSNRAIQIGLKIIF